MYVVMANLVFSDGDTMTVEYSGKEHMFYSDAKEEIAEADDSIRRSLWVKNHDVGETDLFKI